MSFSPQTRHVLDRLQAERIIKSGDVTIGPLVGASKHLLQIFIDKHEQLGGISGEQQGKLLRQLYVESLKAPTDDAVPESHVDAESEVSLSTAGLATPRIRWTLESLKCQSIRGVAPPGDEWEFNFGGKNCLIYGPNGSGKSSMLGCVAWIFTGQFVTDADELEEEAKLYKQADGDGKGASIRAWPVVVTLPDGNPSAAQPFCTATVVLAALDGSQKLFLRRTNSSGLTSSSDGLNWKKVESLSEVGIAPLALQLSLLAPHVFGRQAIDAASNSREILSLMLGFDALEMLGALASTAAGNRTRLANAERKVVEASIAGLREKLSELKEQLTNGTSEYDLVARLAEKAKATLPEIEAAGKLIKDAVVDRERKLAELLGVSSSDGAAPAGLADQLTSAIMALEQGFHVNFPMLHGIGADIVLANVEKGDESERLATIEDKMTRFRVQASERIARRLIWWRRELSEGERTKILLQAAKHFIPARPDCPVCERSVAGLPVEKQLVEFHTLDTELQLTVQHFFRDLKDELDVIVPLEIAAIADILPKERVLQDWDRLRDQVLGNPLASMAAIFEKKIQVIANSIDFTAPAPESLFPKDAEQDFLKIAATFTGAVDRVEKALALLRWSNDHLKRLTVDLQAEIFAAAVEGGSSQSLLDMLLKGKEAAAVVKPFSIVLNGLRSAHGIRKILQDREADLSLLVEIESGLEPLKLLAKYAVSEVATVFDTIRATTVANWKKLYPESGSGLSPFSLSMGKGKDRSIEPLLAKSNYVVQGQHFANAGLQRAIALAFYFALLEQHPGGLGFAVLDDPILSLDDDHRESWSCHLLQPAMTRLQMVIGTHQRQYLNGCKHHFASGRLVELNSRAYMNRITWRPGDRLERVELEIDRAATNAPPEMRKWREEVLWTLDSYSPQRIFDSSNLANSWNRYGALTAPHPLASKGQRKIADLFKAPEVTKVLDPGSHHLTEADVTVPMIRECLRRLKDNQSTVQNEFKRLEDERVRALRGAVITASAIDFEAFSEGARWDNGISLPLFGRAAAKSSGCVVDTAEVEDVVFVAPGSAVLVSGTTLEPIARVGQIALLASPEERVDDGDLIAVTTSSGHHYLRRAWSDGERWILQAVNPVERHPCVVIPKTDAALRKINGVIYDLPVASGFARSGGVDEWKMINTPIFEAIAKLKAITVVGSSLEPVAKTGQRVLVGPKYEHGVRPLPKGTLAVVETSNENIGNVIKRVFPGPNNWLLDSVNQVDPHDPLSIPMGDIRAVWPLHGVLF